MDATPRTTRKLVKALLLPELHAQLVQYAADHHRSVSSAAEHLIALGLAVDQVEDVDRRHPPRPPIHHR